MEYFGYALAFVAGWAANNTFDRAIVKIGIRILTSPVGKKKVLAALANGVENLERKR